MLGLRPAPCVRAVCHTGVKAHAREGQVLIKFMLFAASLKAFLHELGVFYCDSSEHSDLSVPHPHDGYGSMSAP